MKKQEAINIVKWIYFTEERLEQAVKDTEYRFVRRDLDSVDLLEEIIAKENLKFFREIQFDLLRIIGLLSNDEG